MASKTENYDSVEREYYKTGEVAKILDISNSKLRFWLSSFELPSIPSWNNRKIHKDVLVILVEVKKMLHSEGYTHHGVRRQLELKYGKKYEHYGKPAKNPSPLGQPRDRAGEDVTQQDSLPLSGEDKV